MPTPKLSRYEKRLVREIKALVTLLALDPLKLAEAKPKEFRLEALRGARLHYIRGEVITQFTLIDDLLTHEVAIEMLGRAAQPWKRKKVRFERVKSVLNDSRMSLKNKLELYRAYRRVPPAMLDIISGLNAARNALAHVYHLDGFKRKARYRGRDILDQAVFEQYLVDMEHLFDFFLSR